MFRIRFGSPALDRRRIFFLFLLNHFRMRIESNICHANCFLFSDSDVRTEGCDHLTLNSELVCSNFKQTQFFFLLKFHSLYLNADILRYGRPYEVWQVNGLLAYHLAHSLYSTIVFCCCCCLTSRNAPIKKRQLILANFSFTV